MKTRGDENEQTLRRAGERGDAAAAHALGMLLLARDELAEAERWLTVAIEDGFGDPSALDALGRLMELTGRRPDAAALYERAADAGHAPAARNLGLLLEKDWGIETAEPWLRRAAAGGDATAADRVATLDEERERRYGVDARASK